jgi:hypothetical protein
MAQKNFKGRLRSRPQCTEFKRLRNRQCEHRGKPEFRFDPPLTLKCNIVVRNLDDAVRFMVGYRKARRPELLTSVLHRLEGAEGEAEERDAALAFRGWVETEDLMSNPTNK